MMRRILPRPRAITPYIAAPRLLASQQGRFYSIKPEAASSSKPLDIDISKLTIEKTSKPSALEKPEDLVFGKKFTGWYPWKDSG
jgi:branched-chain amino acid aminotransferase